MRHTRLCPWTLSMDKIPLNNNSLRGWAGSMLKTADPSPKKGCNMKFRHHAAYHPPGSLAPTGRGTNFRGGSFMTTRLTWGWHEQRCFKKFLLVVLFQKKQQTQPSLMRWMEALISLKQNHWTYPSATTTKHWGPKIISCASYSEKTWK